MLLTDFLSRNDLTIGEFSCVVHFATLKVGWLGMRYITVKGYEGYATVDALTTVVSRIGQQSMTFTKEEMEWGKEIACKITEFYEKTDEMLANSTNPLYLLYKLFQSKPHSESTHRWFWELGDKDTFG